MAACTPINFVPLSTAVDLTGYEGHEVLVSDAGVVSLAFSTNQATVDATVPGGILTAGCEAGEIPEVVLFDGIYERAIAGTGGVTVGAIVGPEYHGSNSHRGRFIVFGSLAKGDWIRGVALTAADDGGEFVLQCAIRKADAQT